MTNFMNEKVLPHLFKFVNLKCIRALSSGLIFTIPLTIIGGILLLFANLPIVSIANFIENSGLRYILIQGYSATFNIISLIATIGIAYTYAKLEEQEPLPVAFVALVLFFLLIDNSGNIISTNFTSTTGIFYAIIIGLFVGKFYPLLIKKKVSLKFSDKIPSGVSNSFNSLIPAAIIIFIGMAIFGVFKYAFNTTFAEWIYSLIQIPLQNITDSLGGVILISFIVPFLWFFGIHSATIIDSIMYPILIANSDANNKIIQQGLELTIENGGHIVTNQFFHLFINLSGTGITLGLVLYLFFFAKSKQYKEIGKLSFVPALFNINEPILFGIPIVMNPLLALPFIIMPMLSGLILYFSQYFGIVPLFNSAIVPWTTPPIISGFLTGGFKMALLQAFILTLSFFVYLPFIKKVDMMSLEAETLNETK